jgi:glyceraldehyde 3-phosphate dehydrogenase
VLAHRIYSLFTFHFSLFTSFLNDLWCKYRNFFVTLHPKSKKSVEKTEKVSNLGINPFNNLVKMTKVAINGFGRIGRLAFRQMFEAEGYEVVAINDLTSPKMLAHLLKYDTAQGGFAGKFGEGKHTVEATDNSIIVDGKEITIYAMPNAAELPWGQLGVDVVLECTGFYTSKEKASAHLTAGAKKVVISAPAGNDLPTIVYNVNHKTLTPADTVISAASCTTNCLAPMAAALNAYAPIVSGIMSTIHAYTGDQMILDGPQRKGDLRRSRAGAQNIVPNSTGAAKAIGLVIPELNGKLIGSAQRVPTPTGSTTILVAVVKGKDITKEGINAAMKAAGTESFGYTEDQIVSSDIIGMKFGSLFDATQTMVSKIDDDTYQVQVVSWYDNENSYTSQMVRTIKYLAEL